MSVMALAPGGAISSDQPRVGGSEPEAPGSGGVLTLARNIWAPASLPFTVDHSVRPHSLRQTRPALYGSPLLPLDLEAVHELRGSEYRLDGMV